MARHVKNVQCPKCAEAGKDRSKNNLGVFDDGSCYCWSCGYCSSPNHINLSHNKPVEFRGGLGSSLTLPDDVEPYYPARCVAWVGQYELGINDLYANRVLWSEILQRLIFPYYQAVDGPLLGWQGRDFKQVAVGSPVDKRRPKWWGRGNLDNIYHIFNSERARDSLVVVEDVISAIKLGKVGVASLPLFGSHISSRKLLNLRLLTDHLMVWLDPDKAAEAVKFSRKGNMLGLKTTAVFAEHDPKELSYEILKEKLDGHC